MKKTTIWILVIIIIIFGGYLLWHKGNTPSTVTPPDQTTASTKTFVSADQSITFNYPSNLSTSEKNNIITLHHQINYSNHPACDFKGDAPQSPTLTDFNVAIQLLNMTVASSAAVVDPTLATSTNLSGDVLKLNPGFIDGYNNGTYNGYQVTEGIEGCGIITYYLPISSSRTLVIKKDLIGALADIADPTAKAAILEIPGAISVDQSTTIFNSILQSLHIR